MKKISKLSPKKYPKIIFHFLSSRLKDFINSLEQKADFIFSKLC